MAMKTLRVRVRDKHAKLLNRQAKAVNFVWNFCNELSYRCIRERGRFLSGFDFHPYTKGAGKELGLHRRKSQGAKRSLGWVPFKKGAAKFKNNAIYFNGKYFKVWDSYGLENYTFRAGSFSEDARGRWYFNVAVEVKEQASAGLKSIGVDLGLKDIATTSSGDKLQAGQWYRNAEEQLSVAQRAHKKKRVRAIHAKTANRRKDALHKFSHRLVNNNKKIFVGNISSLKLAKTRMAKSTLDAGWGMLKTMLEYKCDNAGVVFREVDEAYSTQVCSGCGTLPDSRPKGIANLGIRVWSCSSCGVSHDRDVNAARNILATGLALGHGRLAGGIPVL
jgi:IS605 OrfB family transposase